MTLRRLALGIVSACCIMGAAGAAIAVTPAPEASVAKHDKDNDETLDLAEVKAAAAEHFDKLNKDGDSTLETKEVQGILGEKAFKAADPDNDGSLSKDEYLALVEKLFKKADPDHDGTLDAAELKSKSGTALRKLIG
jgi:Ca2+-binding EF-hand superfamily protein